MQDSPSRTASVPALSVESFSRFLLQFVRASRIYPPGHPTLTTGAEKTLTAAPWGREGLLTVGVTRWELIVENEVVGGKGTRAGDLAALLHARGVGQVVISRETPADELAKVAHLLNTHTLSGPALVEELKRCCVQGIAVEVLDLERIHSASVWGASAEQMSAAERRRRAWLWVQADDIPAEELARLLASRDLWAAAKEESEDELRRRALALAALSERLEQALGLLNDEQRLEVLGKIAELGKNLTPQDVATLVAADHSGVWLKGLGASALVRDLDPDRFVDVLASLATLGDRGVRRLARVFRRFAPHGGTRSALSLVSDRLVAGHERGFAKEAWKAVEEFLLMLEEDPFMAQDYADLLEAEEDEEPPNATNDELGGDCGADLDRVFLGVAASGGEKWRGVLLDRLSEQLGDQGPFRAAALANLIDEVLPGLVAERPTAVREIFRRGLTEISKAGRGQLQDLLRFSRCNEVLLVGPALRALESEARLATRRFLVEVMGGFSHVTVPAVVTRARAAPWFVARNLTIVLGKQGDPRSAPALRELGRHKHPKVRREARRALSQCLGRATEV